MAIIRTYKCNMCGKEISNREARNGVYFAGRLGYGSTYDGQRIQFDLCTECTDNLIEAFNISPLEDEDNDFSDWMIDSDFLS